MRHRSEGVGNIAYMTAHCLAGRIRIAPLERVENFAHLLERRGNAARQCRRRNSYPMDLLFQIPENFRNSPVVGGDMYCCMKPII